MNMKEFRTFLLLCLRCLLPILLFAAAALRFRPLLRPAPAADAPVPPPVSDEAAPPPASAPEESRPPVSAPPGLTDAEIRFRLLTPEGPLELTLAEYLPGVLAAEMPASFPPEALKAQAAAARTDTLWRLEHPGKHPAGTCCADPACCKAWASEAELRARWGGDYDHWHAAVAEAVSATDGQALLYEDEPILAVFHACSPGQTEASESVWLEALPYLRSVSSPETGENVPDYYASLSLSREELLRLAARIPGTELSGPAETWLTDPEYSPAGRLRTVRLGGVALSGTDLRSLLGLRSTAVTWTVSPEGLTFVTAGYGHGVGMSQQGARLLALEGMDWREILAHYYPGAVPGPVDAGMMDRAGS
jgi:stage II sporulation protein D